MSAEVRIRFRILEVVGVEYRWRKRNTTVVLLEALIYSFQLLRRFVSRFR